MKETVDDGSGPRSMSQWEEEILSYGNNWEHDEGTTHASDLEVILKVIDYCSSAEFAGVSATRRTELLGEVFTSWKEDKCAKLRSLAESFQGCHQSVAYLMELEDSMGSECPIKYTWLDTKDFRSLSDEDKLSVLQQLASGAVSNTTQARNAIKAVPFRREALVYLQEVCLL